MPTTYADQSVRRVGHRRRDFHTGYCRHTGPRPSTAHWRLFEFIARLQDLATVPRLDLCALADDQAVTDSVECITTAPSEAPTSLAQLHSDRPAGFDYEIAYVG
jgi:hypothetical protein